MKRKTLLVLVTAILLSAIAVFGTSAADDLEKYLSDTQLRIETYPLNYALTPNSDGEYEIPVYSQNLRISSVRLKAPSSSSYSSDWSIDYNKWVSRSYQLAKINKRPTVEEGDRRITVKQTVTDSSKSVVAVKEYVLLIRHELPKVKLTVKVVDDDGDPVENADVFIGTNVKRPTKQYPDSNGVYTIMGGYEYIYTVNAAGFEEASEILTIKKDTELTIRLTQKKYKVGFSVIRANGASTEYATLKVFDSENTLCKPLADEYGYDTYNYLLKPGKYSYQATYSSGSEYANGNFEVASGDLSPTVRLAERIYPITFDVTPANAKISLYKNGYSGAYGDPILPNDNGVYEIKAGQYRYTIEADGYVKVSKTFNATDAQLAKNNYKITVRLLSEADRLLKDADDALFGMAGFGFTMNEFTGDLSEPGDEAWDIDSDYDDVNICRYIEEILAKRNPKFKDIKVSIVSVKSDYDWRYNDEFADCGQIEYMPDYYTVIDKDGTINYKAVDEDKIDEDYGGEVCSVFLRLSYGNSELIINNSYDFIVPMHIMTRQERLESLLSKFGTLRTVNGNYDFSFDWDESYFYFVIGKWTSDNTDIIGNDGKITLPERDAVVRITFTVSYSEAQIEDGGFLRDPGPLGEGKMSVSYDISFKGIGHDYSGEYVCLSEANCIYGAVMVKYCSHCGDIVSQYSTQPNGHDFTGWSEENGFMVCRCNVCRYEKSIPCNEFFETPDDTAISGGFIKIAFGTNTDALKNAVVYDKNGKLRTAHICTGDTVVFTVNGVEYAFTAAVSGDVNGDGKIDAKDYIALRRAILGITTLDDAAKLAGDRNGDGKINSADYIAIRKTLLKIA